MNPQALAMFHDASATVLAGYVFLFQSYQAHGASREQALKAIDAFYSEKGTK